MSTSVDVFFDLLREDEVEAAHEIETQGYPPDEAGSLGAIRYRQSNAPTLFLGAYQSTPQPRSLIGFINATLSSEATLSHDSMSTHSPEGTTVCIHSVCVTPSFRNRGVATKLLLNYIGRLEKEQTAERILLICHEELQRLYARVGFELVGKSPVTHGSRDWYEMRRSLRVGISESSAEGLSPILYENLVQALRKPTSSGNTTRLSNLKDVLEMTSELHGKKMNKHALVCIKEGCGSLILKGQVAELRECSSVELEPANHPPSPELPEMPGAGELTSWWLVTPDPMAFENIGFTHPIQAAATSPGRRIKLLACAECDLGPIGWSSEGGNEFWLHASRVGYRL